MLFTRLSVEANYYVIGVAIGAALVLAFWIEHEKQMRICDLAQRVWSLETAAKAQAANG